MDTEIEAGQIEFTFELEGELLSKIFIFPPIQFQIDIDLDDASGSGVISAAPIILALSLTGSPSVFYTTGADIWGSKIGVLTFKLDESNEAFRRPTQSRGGVIKMVKLGARVIVFSTSGIDVILPADLYWKYEHVSDYGALSSWSVCDADGTCWFIDSRKHLVEINDQGFRDHDCHSYFIEDVYALSWDPQWNLLYISGRNDGYVYSPANDSLGKGYAQLTGITPNYVAVGQNELRPEPFEIQTNWYDFGSRAYKTIRSIEFSTATNHYLEAAVDFRHHNDMQPRSTPWKRVTPSGIAYIPCYGTEFRFRLRSNITQQIHLDNIRVIGTIHGYDFLNAIGWAPNANSAGG